MTDDTSSSAPGDLPDGPVGAKATDSSAAHSEAVWVIGHVQSAGSVLPTDATELQQPSDGDLLFAAIVAPEAPPNLDHALDQLTTATDLFDVPVLDYHAPISDT
jgi:hypothetical protein